MLPSRLATSTDFDFIAPYWIYLAEMEGVNHIDAKNSGNTFDETYNYKGVKIDLAINPRSKYKTVIFNGHAYKVNDVLEVLKYKIEYGLMKNGQKHRNDINNLLNL